MNAASRSFNLRKVVGRTAIGTQKDKSRITCRASSVRRPTVREGNLDKPTSVSEGPSLTVGLLTRYKDRRASVSQSPSCRKTSDSDLTLDLFYAGVELKIELGLRNTLVLFNVCQPHGGRIVVLFDHLGLHRHAAAINPNFDVVIAGCGLRHSFEVSGGDTTPECLLAHVLQIAEPSFKLSRGHIQQRQNVAVL